MKAEISHSSGRWWVIELFSLSSGRLTLNPLQTDRNLSTQLSFVTLPLRLGWPVDCAATSLLLQLPARCGLFCHSQLPFSCTGGRRSLHAPVCGTGVRENCFRTVRWHKSQSVFWEHCYYQLHLFSKYNVRRIPKADQSRTVLISTGKGSQDPQEIFFLPLPWLISLSWSFIEECIQATVRHIFQTNSLHPCMCFLDISQSMKTANGGWNNCCISRLHRARGSKTSALDLVIHSPFPLLGPQPLRLLVAGEWLEKRAEKNRLWVPTKKCISC